jgi:hypothetical protein
LPHVVDLCDKQGINGTLTNGAKLHSKRGIADKLIMSRNLSIGVKMEQWHKLWIKLIFLIR